MARYYIQESAKSKLCDIAKEKLNLLLLKLFKIVKKSDGAENEPAILSSTFLEMRVF